MQRKASKLLKMNERLTVQNIKKKLRDTCGGGGGREHLRNVLC